MRLFFAIILIALNSAPGLCQEAEFALKESVYKFPKTREGVLLEHTFVVTNTGKSPLIISSYEVACPCTKVQLPQRPIEPGKTAEIKVSFDTEGKTYYQDRVIYLSTNTKRKTEKIRIKVFVEPKP